MYDSPKVGGPWKQCKTIKPQQPMETMETPEYHKNNDAQWENRKKHDDKE